MHIGADEQRRSREPHQRATDMARAQAIAFEQDGRQQHDQQRPKIVDEVGLDRRRVAQRHEEKEMKAEQAVDAERQRARRHAPATQSRQSGYRTDG